jgi:hypothetical protein
LRVSSAFIVRYFLYGRSPPSLIFLPSPFWRGAGGEDREGPAVRTERVGGEEKSPNSVLSSPKKRNKQLIYLFIDNY